MSKNRIKYKVQEEANYSIYWNWINIHIKFQSNTFGI
jgi:hypothetical protein